MRKRHFLRSVALFLSVILLITSVPEFSFAGSLSETFSEVEINDDVVISDNEAEVISDISDNEAEFFGDVSEADETAPLKDISLDDSYSVENNDAIFGEVEYGSLAVGDVADRNATYIASGRNKGVTWSINSNGLLLVEGTGEVPGCDIYESHDFSNDRPDWLKYSEYIKSAKVVLSGTLNFSNFFLGCSNMTSVDLRRLNTSSAGIMYGMFTDCTNLKSLDLSNFDTSRVFLIDRMFEGCSSLEELDLSTFDFNRIGHFPTIDPIYYSVYGPDFFDIGFIYVKRLMIHQEIFGSNYNLKIIKTPKNVNIPLSLPSAGMWYSSDGKEWGELPMGLDYSITLQRESIPTEEPGGAVSQIYKTKAKLEHGEVEIKLDPQAFFSGTSKDNYNHDLCRFSIALSTLIYNASVIFPPVNIGPVPKAFKELGFDSGIDNHLFARKHFFPDESLYNESLYEKKGSFSPAWIVHRNIIVDGKENTLVCVVIRGTEKEEWYDNFDSGGLFLKPADIHQGFENAAKYVLKNLQDYFIRYDISTSNVKLLITGHSRGAATANLMGKMLDNGECNDLSDVNINNIGDIDTDNIYVYTFATPNVASNYISISTDGSQLTAIHVTEGVEPDSNSEFKNIYNIINPQDFVTKVMPSEWGYGRYGYNYVLPNIEADKYPRDFLRLYNQYKKDVKYECYKYGMEDVQDYVTSITRKVHNVLDYYHKSLLDPNCVSFDYESPSSLHSLFRSTLADYMVNEKFSVWLDPIIDKYGSIGRETFLFFAYHAGGIWILRDDFRCAHTPETYLAFLYSKEMTVDQLKKQKKYKKAIVNCPVDVIVRDEDGTIVGEIRSNEVNEDYEMTMSVDGDSKRVLLSTEGEYTLELIGNDSGVMDYSIVEFDADCGEIGRTTYIGVPVEEGLTYTQTIAPETSVEDVVLLDESNEVVEPTGYFTEENRGQLSVEVNSINGGYASGYASLTPGDYVTLAAYPDENNSFVGWFDENGEMVSSDAEYGVSVSKDMDLNAVFTDKLNEYSDSIYVAYDSCGGTGGHILFDVAKDSALVIPSENPTKAGYNFLGWYTEKNGQGTRVTDKMKVRDNLVLYAYWVKENCTVTFATDRFEDYNDVSGNVAAMSPVTVQGGMTYLLTAPAPIEGYSFGGWFTGENGSGEQYTDSTMIIDDVTLYPFWKHTGFSVGAIDDYVYTGAPITPVVKVYDGTRQLEINKDYTLEYSNNINVGDKNSEVAPTITVNGIGNYAGSAELTFNILPKDLGDGDVTAKDIILNYTGAWLFAVPAILHNGKALASGENKDYTFEVYAAGEETPVERLADIGNYKIVATGHGNYTGTKEINLEVAKLTPISKVSVAKIYDVEYTGDAIEPKVTLTYGGRVLKAYSDDETSYDYTVSYSNNVDAGIATITITGNRAAGFSGTRTVKFEIKGTPINKVNVANSDGTNFTTSYPYTGSYIRPKLSLTVKKGDTVTTLESGTDYTLTYFDNKEVGTATIRIIGKGRYTGTKEITFAITPYSLKKDTEGIVEVNGIPVTDGKIVFPEGEEIKVPYTKGSVKVSDLTVTFNGKKLTLGTDYSVSYTNSKKAAGCTDEKAPTLVIKGKGSFADSLSLKFTITKQSIASESVSMTLTEPEYTNQTGIWKIKPVLKESNGQTLKEGTDYDNITYSYLNDTEIKVAGETVNRAAGDLVTDKDIIPIGTVIRITVTGKGNYGATDAEGTPYTRSADYIVRSETISAAVVGIAVQDYVGSEIIPDAADIAVTVAGRSTPLTYGVDYTIEAGSDNVNAGDEATVIIRGIGDYSGVITRVFTIKAKEISWWWTID